MSYVISIVGLGIAIMLWAVLQRVQGKTLEDQEEEGCATCGLHGACSVANPETCDTASVGHHHDFG